MDARPFLRATSSLHARTTRVRFESRKTRSRLSPHRRFSTRPDGRKRFRKSEKKPRAQFSDSASRTLNVLKYVVAFFGPFWRNPRVNIFLVPCLRPLLRARWLPMVRRRLLFCEEEEDGVWKEGGGGKYFRCDLKRRAKKVFHNFLRLIILIAMSTEILDRFFTQTKGIILRHF